uniref:uncharacterized protein LOC108950932 n=1 Tax=Ciona intestinalis TaxID=7719 RepID=UPI000EF51401|nr:uncharacterized protein LOC108950932 [Ciona intestinalis]|eukprot:XP_026696071.1 uncharacterized protein LOC108950932 [Ciona intestinalis]
MTRNNYAYIDAVKTSDGTGWEWSTTHDKFYFKTTRRGYGGPTINYGKYNNWHLYSPNNENTSVIGSELEKFSWSWQSVSASTVAHYICQITAMSEYYKGSYFFFMAQVVNHAGAKSTCVELGGHLAIIPDAETQAFIQTKGAAYKKARKWMTSNNHAYIDAVKTSDGTGWEWSTTHDKFYFKTTSRGIHGPHINNGKYNNWHIYRPNYIGNYAVIVSNYGKYSWSWNSVSAETMAHYICQVRAKFEYFNANLFHFSPQTVNHAAAKSTCVELGGHLAIIPDAETQAFIQTKGAAYKSEGKWMINNNNAWIDAVKTSDGTGWEWSTTHDKFYFKTTPRVYGDSNILNGRYSNWHIHSPYKGNKSAMGSNLGYYYSWSWQSVSASTVAHYICQITAMSEYYKGSYFIFVAQVVNHADAKSTCVELGGHLAIIPDAKTQTFIQTKGEAYKKARKWMTSNNDAYIDAVKTSDGTGWEWSTTHDKFYFKTTPRGKGSSMVNGKYNNWHIYNPNKGDYGMTSSYSDAFIWRWRSTYPLFIAHYICQFRVKSTKLVASKSTLNVKYGEDFVLCSSNTNLGPLVSWRINSRDVSTNANDRVYQIITQPSLVGVSTSRLYLTRGLHRNSGVYTCNATSLEQSAVTNVTIDKRPRLLEIKSSPLTYTFIGETLPNVHWEVNGVTVEQGISFITNTMLNTHEVSSQVSNLLIFGSTDVVSCWANTSDGSSNLISKTGFSDAPSSAITSSPGGCPGNQLQINWTDITKTSGNIIYNVSITSSSLTYTKTVNQTSTSDNKYSITFDNLTPRTEYNIEVDFFPRFTEASKQVELSTTSTTQCKLNTSYAISCTNKLLANGDTYRFQVVTLTPADGIYLTQTSHPIVTTLSASYSTIIIASAVGGVCILIALIVAIVIYKKKRGNLETQGKSQRVKFVQPNNAFQQDDTNYQEAYVNMDQNFQQETTSQNPLNKSYITQDGYVDMHILNPELNIPTNNLLNRYRNMLAFNEAAFKKQFQELATATKKIKLQKTFAEKTENHKKNRDKNTLPYDCTRVKLKGNSGYSYYSL